MPRAPRSLREDVHIHASADVVRALLDPATPEAYGWLPAAFTQVEPVADTLAFHLALLLRTEHAALRRIADDGRAIEFTAPGGGALRALTWVVNSEGEREVHLLAEAVYEPAGGPIGALLEAVLHGPTRRQALRDALWLLKLTAEDRGGRE